jgi:hypothetical protein
LQGDDDDDIIIIALMMEAGRTSETLHGATTKKTAIFVLTAVRTSNPTQLPKV